MTTHQIVQDILQEHLGIETLALTPDATFTDLNADSLDMVEIVMSCESEFSIHITDHEVSLLRTIHDLTTLIDNHLRAL